MGSVIFRIAWRARRKLREPGAERAFLSRNVAIPAADDGDCGQEREN
jgi:hypothetical protein